MLLSALYKNSDRPMYSDFIRKTIRDSCEVKQGLLHDAAQIRNINLAISKIIQCITCGHKVMVMGNGGSASDAQHFCAELIGRFMIDNRRSYPCIALTANTSNITSIANDYGYEKIFSRQIEALAQKGDIVMALSTSGRSPNIHQGLVAAKKKELFTIGLTGGSAGLRDICDICIQVPSSKTSHIQEAHIMILHTICEIIDKIH